MLLESTIHRYETVEFLDMKLEILVVYGYISFVTKTWEKEQRN